MRSQVLHRHTLTSNTSASGLFRRRARHLSSALLAFGLLCSSAAWAEEPAADKASAGSEMVDTEVEITEKARELFRAGVDFMQDPDGARYAEAYRSFKAAYAESPSWKILGNLGISAMKIERDGEALEALETYLREGREGFDKDELEQVERDIRTLKAAMTWITISSEVDGASIEDVRTPLSGNPVNNRYGELSGEMRIGVHNGRHQITLRKEGFEPAVWTFTAAGEDLTHAFELIEIPEEAPVVAAAQTEPEMEKTRPVPTVTWIALGTAGASTIAATVTGILALGKQSDFDDNNGTDQEAAQKAKDSGETLNLTTDILIGVAVVSAGVAAVTYFTRPVVEVERDQATAQRSRHAVSVSPVALRKGGGLFVQGRF